MTAAEWIKEQDENEVTYDVQLFAHIDGNFYNENVEIVERIASDVNLLNIPNRTMYIVRRVSGETLKVHSSHLNIFIHTESDDEEFYSISAAEYWRVTH